MYDANIELIHKYKNGDEQCLEIIVEKNMGLVRMVVKRFMDRGCEYEDLLQIGTMGMIKAVKSFDLGYQTAFSTYAIPLIMGEIKKYLRDDGIIKVSRDIKKKGYQITKIKNEYVQSKGVEPTFSELSRLSGLSPEVIAYTLEAISPLKSIHDFVNGESEYRLEEMLSTTDDEYEKMTDKLALHQAIAELTDLQQKILFLRYQKELSQQQTGRILGLTQVKISREEKKILNILKSKIAS